MSVLYAWLSNRILDRGRFGIITLPEVLNVNPWAVVIPVALVLTALLAWMDVPGL